MQQPTSKKPADLAVYAALAGRVPHVDADLARHRAAGGVQLNLQWAARVRLGGHRPRLGGRPTLAQQLSNHAADAVRRLDEALARLRGATPRRDRAAGGPKPELGVTVRATEKAAQPAEAEPPRMKLVA